MPNVIAGLVLLALFAFSLARRRAWLRGCATVQGTVQQVHVRRLHKPGGTVTWAHYPEVAFEHEGQRHVVEDPVGTGPGRHAPGDVVRVRVPRAAPGQARIDEGLNLWGWEVVLLVLGSGFLLSGLYLLSR